MGSSASTPETASEPSGGAHTRVRLRDSLAVRVAVLVSLVLFVAGTSTVVVLGRLRALQQSFDLLTGVYVVFNQRLAEAQVQAVRVGAQVSGFREDEQQTPSANLRSDSAFTRNFVEALDTRNELIRAAAAPVRDAVNHPDVYGGGERLAQLRGLRASLDDLETVIATDDVTDPVEVLRDPRTQGEVERLMQSLAAQSSRAVGDLQREVRTAQRRTERLTLGLTVIVGLLAAVVAFAVFWTLRPLRQLALGVRRLGRGDWSQRVPLPGARPRGNDEVYQLAREFNVMADALEERERRLLRGERLAAAGQLAAQITHEIRNPLASVALNAELLEDELDDPSQEVRQLLARIANEVDRLTSVTDDYLTFARRPKFDPVPVDLRAEVDSLLDFLAEEHGQANVKIDCQLGSQPMWVMGDANQLRQATLNLLRNAKEAALDDNPDRGDAEPLIQVSLVCKDDMVRLVVRDNGPGIPTSSEPLDRIFEAFYTRKARGTGLGLPIVQQIVSDHGGSVAVVETGRSGSTFEVRIPSCAAPGASVSSTASPASLADDAGSL